MNAHSPVTVLPLCHASALAGAFSNGNARHADHPAGARKMSSKPRRLIRFGFLAALLAATSACAPTIDSTTRLSTSNNSGCRFAPDTCADLHKTRASIW